MARGGNPNLTWLEDQVIALSMIIAPVAGDFESGPRHREEFP